MEIFSAAVETIGLVIDAVGVLVIVAGLVYATYRYFSIPPGDQDPFVRLRQDLGRGILLGLEFLVAADIIRTVAVDPTLENVAVLGLIVLIRTVLSMALQVELEGHWPWQKTSQRGQLPTRLEAASPQQANDS
ncbi:MAG: DUF1622 domain-containing protein [bacterium]|nr:DUF1622 domain-containing protein [bacterium]